MNRITFVALCAGLCLVPFLFFAAVQGSTSGSDGYYSGGSRYYHRRGPSFLFMSFGNHYGGGYSSRGRGYSSGGFRGGGSRSGK